MCRQLILTNELYLGSRQLGFEVFSLPKGEILEFTSKQLKDIIRQGKDDVYGLTLSETNELVPDTENFYCTNWMVKSHINSLVPKYESENMIANLFFTVIGTRIDKGNMIYKLLSSRYERLNVTEEKVKTLLEMGIINAGAKLENGKVIVASLEKQKQEITTEPVNKATTADTKEAVKTGAIADSKDTKEPVKALKAETVTE